MKADLVKHRGGCHCGAVKYEVLAPAVITVTECNCSICSKSGFAGLIVPKEQFKLLSGREELREYTFNTGTARHLFCRICGIKSFYRPRSHPEGVSVNANCLAPDTIERVKTKTFDGQNWEKYYPSGRADSYPESDE